MTGNEAAARGAWEGGVVFASAYPGTPSTEILETVASEYKEIISEWAPNEKVALEAAVGASFAGGRALAAMKHVGLNVAADPLFTFAYTGVTGGTVIISADDPGMHSSQNEQDNRYYAVAAKIGMMEPSDSQETKDMMKEALELSERFDTPILLRMTTRICHSKSLVELGERTEREIISYQKNRKYDPIPAVSRKLHKKVEERLALLAEFSNSTPLNYEEWNGSKTGIIVSGVAYQYAKEVFGDRASYLKLGFTHPLPMKKIRDFADRVEQLYVIEELEPYMENQIRAAGIHCTGKDKLPVLYELNPAIIEKALLGTGHELLEGDETCLADRPPTFCAGCPHRGFFYELAKKKDVVVCSDIGCYALSGMEPLNAKDIAICMGGGFSVAHGAQKIFEYGNTGKKCVGVMGDSTFFHSGMTSLLEAVYNRSNVLLTILDNRITGMTGHQENPGTGYTIAGEATVTTDIEAVVRALGVVHVRSVNPLMLDEVKAALDWGLGLSGPVVLITRWPCALKRLSMEDQKEFGNWQKKNRVKNEDCIGCKLCLKCGCPALSYSKEDKTVSINPVSCLGCDICAQICPRHAIVRREQ